MEYLVPIRFGFSRNWKQYKDWLKALPGVTARFNGTKFDCWMLPIECAEIARKKALQLGVSVSLSIPVSKHRQITINADGLYPWQKEGAQKAAENRRWILGDEMGLGKTCQAIAAIKALDVKRCLTVSPAVVRSAWIGEFAKWWGDCDRSIAPLTQGRNRKNLPKPARERLDAAYSADFQIVSYALLANVDRGPWDCIILDECHRLSNPEAAQSKAVRKIIEANPNAAVFALTGTLMPDQPKQAYNVLDTVWPGRFGKNKFAFFERYCEKEVITDELGNKYGTDYFGINKENAAELAERIAKLSSRVTKQEVAHLLPPFTVQMLRVEGSHEEKQLTFQDWQEAQEKLNYYGEQKIPYVLEWLEDATQAATHVCVLTHRRETVRTIAESIAAKLRTSYGSLYTITGEDSPEARNQILADSRRSEKSVVVATMHSIGIGIDLTFCTQALFAELYYRPETVLQALGRFSRLSGKVPSSCTLMCVQSTVDEVMANTLMSKIAAINSVLKSDLSSVKLDEALRAENEDLDSLNKACAGLVAGGAYD